MLINISALDEHRENSRNNQKNKEKYLLENNYLK